MGSFLSGFILVLVGVYTLVFSDGFVSFWIGMLFLWWGLGNIFSGGSQRKATINSRYSGNQDNIFDIPGVFSLVHKLRGEFVYQSPENILSAVIASICIHIAKSDGRISEEEIDAIRFFIASKFKNVDHDYIKRIVVITRQHIEQIGSENLFQSIIEVIELYLNLVRSFDKENRESLTFLIFGVIYEVAIADGGIHPNEEILFQRICNYFYIPRDYQAQIKRSAHYNYNVRQNQKERQNTAGVRTISESEKFQESLNYFSLDKNYSTQDLDKAWKKVAMMYHPDRYHNANEETYNLMNEKFLEGKKIYEYLKQFIDKPRP